MFIRLLFEASINRAFQLWLLSASDSDYVRLIFFSLLFNCLIALRIFVDKTLALEQSIFEESEFFIRSCLWEKAFVILWQIIEVSICHLNFKTPKLLSLKRETSYISHNDLIKFLNLTLLLHINAIICSTCHGHINIHELLIVVVIYLITILRRDSSCLAICSRTWHLISMRCGRMWWRMRALPLIVLSSWRHSLWWVARTWRDLARILCALLDRSPLIGVLS